MQKFYFYQPTYPIFSPTVTGNKQYFFLGLKQMTETQTYLADSAKQELSNKKSRGEGLDRFQTFWGLVHWTKVASAMKGLGQ